MSNEARIRSGLQILKRNATGDRTLLDYQARPESFAADVTGTKGPVPGAITCTTAGTDISFSELTTPGLCRIMNLDSNNYVEVGIWEPTGSIFYPLMELLPGESYVIRLSRNLQEQYAGTGTGTTAPTNTVRVKANAASCVVLVEAFEK